MRRFGVLLMAALSMTALNACTADPDPVEPAFGDEAQIGLDLNPSSRSMVVGETITVMAETKNLLGRDVEIEWYAPGGEIKTEDEGRIARVHFESPGTYTVSARLFADGKQVKRDAVTIRVQPLE
jgi:hypothetical protein